ncbi:MAG: glucose-6-phosphate dehydrogenase [Bacteroidetes bacterium]|jgi:glucose-6-phosphate 1-dehydrogenase|nr:MAG: glucose-6-phosphate dehydrogenase [Bacteroidota bacterium]TAF93521.1 MAG: glucose-6-phosphate dehydrogenase [Bacteroidota bacterium]
MSTQIQAPPSILFIFGGSGDLNYRKLSPALYNLFLDGYLPANFAIVGLGRTSFTNESFREHIYAGIQEFSRRKQEIAVSWPQFAEHLFFLPLDAKQADSYQVIHSFVQEKEAEWQLHPNVILYLAVAPQLVPGIVTNLSNIQLCHDKHCTRIVVEKPFGNDLASAKKLNELLLRHFAEEQIYRIDHYLGKETVQNILALRFANALFEPIWNRNYIDHIQITNAETVGLEGRGGYYDTSGALRDMLQNHILQIVCIMAMEAPVNFNADEIRNKKVDVLRALRPFTTAHVRQCTVRGQYGAGTFKNKEVAAYTTEEGVQANSTTETFAAVEFHIDNWRWQGVPFFVRTGKRLAAKTTVITVQFKPAPHVAFPQESANTWRPNTLTISIQPEMDIRLQFQAKKPGQDFQIAPVDMVFSYKDAYTEEHQPEAYETLLLDVMEGNPTQFMRADQIEAAWQLVMPIIEHWQQNTHEPVPTYAPGSWGPQQADELLSKQGRNWVSYPPKTN